MTNVSTNERVALAMGWERSGNWWRRGIPNIRCGAPAYYTDPATIPEMLAWLVDRSDTYSVNTYSTASGVRGQRVRSVNSMDPSLVLDRSEGPTIQAALADLVLAVKAREEQQ